MAEAEQRWNERLCLGTSVPPPLIDSSGPSRLPSSLYTRVPETKWYSGNIKMSDAQPRIENLIRPLLSLASLPLLFSYRYFIHYP